MNINELEDRELNMAVAELMGMPFRKPGHGTCCTCQTCGWDYDNCQCLYSRDIAAAWLVVEKMQKPDWAWHIESVYVSKKLMWFVTFWGDENGELITNDGAEEETLPLAICRAALMAAEAE